MSFALPRDVRGKVTEAAPCARSVSAIALS